MACAATPDRAGKAQPGLVREVELDAEHAKAAPRFFPATLAPNQPQRAGDGVKSLPPELLDLEPPARGAPRGPPHSLARATGAEDAPGWRLSCIYSEGLAEYQLVAMPPGSRTIGLPGGPTLVGREHQPGVFKALLGRSPGAYERISRTHMLVRVHRGVMPSVTNMSANTLYVDKEGFRRGESCILTAGQVLSFARPEGDDMVHFLALRLVAVERHMPEEARAVSPPGAEVVSAAYHSPRPQLHPGEDRGGPLPPHAAQHSPRPRLYPAAVRTPAEPPLPAPEQDAPPGPRDEELSSGRPGSGILPGPIFALDPRGSGAKLEADRHRPDMASWALPILAQLSRAAAAPPPPPPPRVYTYVSLELCGPGVVDLPPAQRRIGPYACQDLPVTVGRKHQGRLFQGVVRKELLRYIGREHFRIASCDGGATFQLQTLAARPLWHARGGGRAPEELRRGDDDVELVPDDGIILCTGEHQGRGDAEEDEEEGPAQGCKLCRCTQTRTLYLRFTPTGPRAPLAGTAPPGPGMAGEGPAARAIPGITYDVRSGRCFAGDGRPLDSLSGSLVTELRRATGADYPLQDGSCVW